jgi:hypothetical protein
LTRSAALEYAGGGIRVNAVCPALVDTPLIHDADGSLFDYIKPLIGAHPLRRIARSEEIADAIVWLCSDKSSYVTGVALPVDGGYSAQSQMHGRGAAAQPHIHDNDRDKPDNSPKPGEHKSTPPLPPDDHLDPRAIHRRPHRLRTGPLAGFPNSADAELKVHHRARREADVTEGSGGVWERLHYD